MLWIWICLKRTARQYLNDSRCLLMLSEPCLFWRYYPLNLILFFFLLLPEPIDFFILLFLQMFFLLSIFFFFLLVFKLWFVFVTTWNSFQFFEFIVKFCPFVQFFGFVNSQQKCHGFIAKSFLTSIFLEQFDV